MRRADVAEVCAADLVASDRRISQVGALGASVAGTRVKGPAHGAASRSLRGWPATSGKQALSSTRFKQEPGTSLRLVDPVLNKARRGDIAQIIHDIVNLPKATGESLIVFSQFRKHILRIDISASLSDTRCMRLMCPMERSVVPPVFLILSAMGSVIAYSWSACSSRSRW